MDAAPELQQPQQAAAAEPAEQQQVAQAAADRYQLPNQPDDGDDEDSGPQPLELRLRRSQTRELRRSRTRHRHMMARSPSGCVAAAGCEFQSRWYPSIPVVKVATPPSSSVTESAAR